MLISYKAFCKDILKEAGVDKGDLGYLKEEATLEERASVTLQEQDEKARFEARQARTGMNTQDCIVAHRVHVTKEVIRIHRLR